MKLGPGQKINTRSDYPTYLKSIRNMLRVPTAYRPKHAKKVKYRNEEALPKSEEDLKTRRKETTCHQINQACYIV
jgi:hypothetical protein